MHLFTRYPSDRKAALSRGLKPRTFQVLKRVIFNNFKKIPKMAFPTNSTCPVVALPTLTGCTVPFRQSKIKKILAINSTVTTAELTALLPAALGGAGTSVTITAGLNALVTNNKLKASPIIGGVTVAEPATTTITNTNACAPINVVTGQDITFNSTSGSTALTSTFVTSGQGIILDWQEREWWSKFNNCFFGGLFLVDCDSNLYYLLNNNFDCVAATGASAFPTLSATANLTIDETGIWTWKGKISSSTGFTIRPAFNLGAITGAGAANSVLL